MTVAPAADLLARSLRLEATEGGVRLAPTEHVLDEETSWGDVLVRVQHSGVNYKDALAATGRGRVARRVPLTPGIDAAGEVLASADPRFASGDLVVLTGHGAGETHDGGWSDLLRVPGDWLDPLPATLSTQDAMAVGTAGVTAALAVTRLERGGVRPGDGPVAVTGATGASGSHAVAMLAAMGHEVVAITGSASARERLLALGAAAVEPRPEHDPGRPLGSARWAGAVDCVGGDPLAWLLATTRPEGTVAAFGNTAGNHLPVTVLPFILRGVSLVGVNAADLPAEVRRDLWQRLGSDLVPADGATTHPLADAPRLVEEVLAGRTTGRVVLDVG